MKVALVTLRGENYGSSLQQYALWYVLEHRYPGTQCVFLNYQRDYLYDAACWLARKTLAALLRRDDTPSETLGEFVHDVLGRKQQVQNADLVRQRFREFWSLSRTEGPFTRKSIRSCGDLYSKYFVGSDQVWNCGRLNINTAYMLDFVKQDAKKYSYASSVGLSAIPPKYRTRYQRCLGSFHRISCRESSSRQMLETLLQRPVEVHLDPTLLLDGAQWHQTAAKGQAQLPQEPYILVYTLLHDDPLALDTANRVARQAGISRVMVLCGNLAENEGAGPLEWLQWFEGAAYVVTDSFHGTVFSTVFHKPFAACVPDVNTGSNAGNRIVDYLTLLGLEQRILRRKEDLLPEPAVAYEEADGILQRERQRSFAYLDACMED